MRFLLDVHIGSSIARALETRGHVVICAAQTYGTWSDKRLLELAVEQQLVLVTEDSDFSELVFRDGATPPPSILYLRCDPTEQPLMGDRILLVLENVNVTDHIVVIRPTDFRLRPFSVSRNANA